MQAASSAAAVSSAVANEASLAPACKREGQIYTWGFCTHGQLGLKETVLGAREYVEVPTHAGPGTVLRNVELRDVACGHFHTVALDSLGNVFAFGRNDRGQLGGGCDDDESGEVAAGTGAVPRRLKGLRHCIIKDVTCGAFHCLARTADGTIYSWGWNKHGQLGRPTAYQSDVTPALVREALYACTGPLKSFTAGFSHSAAVLWNGQVIVWGSNELGQLGVGSAVRHPEVAVTPLLVPDVAGLQVSAGDNHLLILTLDGEVVAAGETSYGRLGTGSEHEDDGHFTKVLALPISEDPTKESIKAVAAGGATSAAVSTSGRLYTWGGNSWGQLGHGDRTDRFVPLAVSGISRVRCASIAQDFMLATCVQSRSAEGLESADDDPSASLSLWAWGRRQLLPKGVGSGTSSITDQEAQCVPAEVPMHFFGALGSLQAKGAQVKLHALCGGSHSIVIGAPISRDSQASKYQGAARCPRMTSVIGKGTKGGGVCDTLPFKIVSRNEDGRDQKVGGLRFCVWAKPISEIRPRRTGSAGEQPHHWDTHPFDLQFVIDRTDGTYDGSYVIRRPGHYFLHVHMLREGEDMNTQEQPNVKSCGDPVSGSPFRIEIDSGPAFAPLCLVQLRAPACTKRGALNIRRSSSDAVVSPSACKRGSTEICTTTMNEAACDEPAFTVEASSEVVWEICSYDIFGNAVTQKKDRFSAHIAQQGRSEAEDTESVRDDRSPSPKAGWEPDLADSMGLPKVKSGGGSPAAAALRERVRQRKAERLWSMVSTQSFGFSAVSPKAESKPTYSKETSLHVKQSALPGVKEVRWTPTAVGRYHLAVALLPVAGAPGNGSPSEEPIGSSPFEVRVVPGRPSAAHSRLLVGSAATSTLSADRPDSSKDPVVFSADDCPRADVPIRLVLCDRMENICQESSDPLQFVNVRIENVSFLDFSATPPPKAIESRVVPCGSRGAGLYTLQLEVSSDLLQMLAKASVAGELEDGSCTMQLFISANDKSKGRLAQRLIGSPCRLELEILASSWRRREAALQATPTCSSLVDRAKAGIAAAVAEEARSHEEHDTEDCKAETPVSRASRAGSPTVINNAKCIDSAADSSVANSGESIAAGHAASVGSTARAGDAALESTASGLASADSSTATADTAGESIAIATAASKAGAAADNTSSGSTSASGITPGNTNTGVTSAGVASFNITADGCNTAQRITVDRATSSTASGCDNAGTARAVTSSLEADRTADGADLDGVAVASGNPQRPELLLSSTPSPLPATAPSFESAAACLASSVSSHVPSTSPEQESRVPPLALKLPLASLAKSCSTAAMEEASGAEIGRLTSESDPIPPRVPRSPAKPPTPESGHSASVRTPPAAAAVQELQERRSLSVQLPPIAAALPVSADETPRSAAASSGASTAATTPSTAVTNHTSTGDATEGLLLLRTASRGSSRGTKAGNATNIGREKSATQQSGWRHMGVRPRKSAEEQHMKWMPTKAERKMLSGGGQAARNASHGSNASSEITARQRRSQVGRGGSAGLLFHDAPLAAPSPWPQAR